jgi:hypothetical protein
MTNNINWATNSVKAGFTGFHTPTQTFLHEIRLDKTEQKVLLSDLADRSGLNGLLFADDKPYEPQIQDIPKIENDIKNDIELVSIKEDLKNKNTEPLTLPPQKDETKDLILNGALVFLGVLVLVKILS